MTEKPERPPVVIPRQKYFLSGMTLVALKDGDRVTLVHYSDFSRMYVMPVLKDGEMLMLADDIKLCELKQEAMTELPEPGEIILVKYRMNSGGPAYYRAVVSLAAQGKLVVRLLEAGEKILVDIADCKYANAAVLKHPVYSRSVVLAGLHEKTADLMMSRVSKYLRSISKTKLTIEIVDPGKHSMATPMVKLYYGQGNGQRESVSDGILGTAIWFWKKSFLRGNITDEAIRKDLEAGKAPVKLHEMPIQQVPLGEEIHVKIAKFTTKDFVIGILQLPKMKHDFQVFEKQIQKYAEIVGATPYYPEVDEVVLMRMSGDTEWKRGARVRSSDGNMLFALDYGNVVPLCICEIRRIPLEFTLVGTFAVYAEIEVPPMEGLTEDQISETLKKVFFDDTIHMLRVEAIDSSTAVVKFSCPNLMGKVLQLHFGGPDVES